eukprot:4273015-Lingulodinium_polyedra.AAC.1
MALGGLFGLAAMGATDMAAVPPAAGPLRYRPANHRNPEGAGGIGAQLAATQHPAGGVRTHAPGQTRHVAPAAGETPPLLGPPNKTRDPE